MAIELEDFCNTMQQDLADLAGDNYGATRREATGLLSAATSPANKAGYTEPTFVDSGDGKLKQALLEWIQPSAVSETLTSMQDICSAGTEEAKQRELRTLTGFASTPVKAFSNAELRKYCESPSEHRAMIANSLMSALFRKINQVCITQYLAGVGGFIGGVAAGKSVQMLDGSGAIVQADPNGEFTILEDFADLGASGRPLVVGAGFLSQYVRLQGIGCCNDYGQDIGQVGQFDFYRDRDVDVIAAGTNNILAFAPGSVQFVNWVQNKGEFRQVMPDWAESSIIDPVTGIEIDMEIRYDQCDKAWKMVFYSHFDLYTLPLTMFKVADERDGTNNALHYIATKSV